MYNEKKLFGFTSSCKNEKLSGRLKIIFVNHTLVWINLVLYPAKICDNERVGAMKEWGQLGWGECPSYRQFYEAEKSLAWGWEG